MLPFEVVVDVQVERAIALLIKRKKSNLAFMKYDLRVDIEIERLRER